MQSSEFADADRAQAEHAGKGRADLGLGEGACAPTPACLVDGELRAFGIGIALRGELAGDQVGDAFGLAPALRDRRLPFLHVGTGDGAVEREQQVVAAHACAFLEGDRFDAAGDFGSDHHRFVGAQRAHGGGLIDHRFDARCRGFDRCRRHLPAGCLGRSGGGETQAEEQRDTALDGHRQIPAKTGAKR
jgi:hypothetical protein